MGSTSHETERHEGVKPLEVGARLPSFELPTLGGRPADTRAPVRGAAALMFVHHPGCEGCLAYISRVAKELPAENVWAATAVPVMPADAAFVERAMREHDVGPLPFPVLLDTNNRLREQCGVDEGAAAVFVADRWGQIYDRTLAGSTHDLPTAHELEEWFTFLAVYCAECNVEPASDAGSG